MGSTSTTGTTRTTGTAGTTSTAGTTGTGSGCDRRIAERSRVNVQGDRGTNKTQSWRRHSCRWEGFDLVRAGRTRLETSASEGQSSASCSHKHTFCSWRDSAHKHWTKGVGWSCQAGAIDGDHRTFMDTVKADMNV